MGTTPLAFVPCHRRPDRSFRWRGRPFPLCARCTGVAVGYASFVVFAAAGVPAHAVALGVLLNLPAALDGGSQALGWRRSNNALRLVTGILCGTGQVLVIAAFGLWSGRTALRLLGG